MAKPAGKRELFCREYLIDLNATKAAIRAGYSLRSATMQGSRLLTKDDIKQRIAELNEARLKSLKIDASYVLRQAVKLHERCMQEVSPITDRSGEEIQDAEGKTIYTFNARDAVSSLKLIGEHIDVQAFKKQVVTENIHDIAPLKSLSELFTDRAKDGEKTISAETQTTNSEVKVQNSVWREGEQ